MEFVKRHPLLSIFTFVGATVLAVVLIARANESAEELSTRALRNYHRGFVRQASSDIARALVIDPDGERTLIVAATIAMGQGNLEQSQEYYSRITTPRMLDNHVALAESALRSQHLEIAEQVLNAVRQRRPDHPLACKTMLQVYRSCYRYTDHRQFIIKYSDIIEPDRNDVDFMFGLYNSFNTKEIDSRAETRDLDGSDHLVRFAACVNHILHRQFEPAKAALQQLIVERRDLIEAHAKLGVLLVDTGSIDELLEWFLQLPPESLMHPDCCWAAGAMFESLDAPEKALACYHQALLNDYRNPEAQRRLAAMLEQSGSADAAMQLQQISEKQTELLEVLQSNGSAPGSINFDATWGMNVLDVLMQLGWMHEAKAWCGMFKGDGAARFEPVLAEINDRLALLSEDGPDDAIDWPAIAPILRSAELPPPFSEEQLLQEQAALRGE